MGSLQKVSVQLPKERAGHKIVAHSTFITSKWKSLDSCPGLLGSKAHIHSRMHAASLKLCMCTVALENQSWSVSLSRKLRQIYCLGNNTHGI